MDEWEGVSRDPNELTRLLLKLGVQGCEIEEVYNLENLEDSKHVHGILLLYSWNPKLIKESVYFDPELCTLSLLDPKFSVIEGILTILFNSDISIGSELTNFKNLIMPLPSKLRAVALHNSEFIKSVNNSFPSNTETKENLFFSCFLPRNGKVIEIEGLGNGPIYLGEGNEED